MEPWPLIQTQGMCGKGGKDLLQLFRLYFISKSSEASGKKGYLQSSFCPLEDLGAEGWGREEGSMKN